jgi:hypothetical protein
MEREILNSRTQGQRNAWESEDMFELRNGPSTTRLHQKKLIAPSCDIRFSSLLGWIEAQERKVFNGKRNLESQNSGPEKRLEKWRCVLTEERTDHDPASPEKAHSYLVRYPIFEFFRLNRSAREQGSQWKEKFWSLELRARETPGKVKMCLNWGTDRARPGFTRKSS